MSNSAFIREARPSRSVRREPHAARAADNHHLFTSVPLHMYSPCELRVALPIFNCLVRESGAEAAVKGVVNYSFQNTGRPVDGYAAAQSPADSGHSNHFAATGAPSGHRAQGWCGREIDARDLDDGLPRGFLAGAIVEVWVALRLNWA